MIYVFFVIGGLLFACSLHPMSDPVDKKERVLRRDVSIFLSSQAPQINNWAVGKTKRGEKRIKKNKK